MAGNRDLNSAKAARKDEFYTQLTDIEKEMRYYRRHFAGKTVFCNCDDPYESNFFKYFVLNFNRLGLRKLIATCYTGSPIANKQLSIFDIIGDGEEKADRPYKAVVNTVYDVTGDGAVDMLDVAELFKTGENELTELQGDGDFRSPECLELLDEADIVVTNPPFSLFREYVAVLMEHRKKFIIIGNINAVKYKEVFPLFMKNELWLGSSIHSGDRAFFVPEDYPLDAAGCGIDEGTGRKFIRVKGVRWFTNLDIRQRHEELILVKRYDPACYPIYDNMPGCINVDKTADIPCDYVGPMGVPITFIDKYSPDQFEILGLSRDMDLPNKVGISAEFLEKYYAQGGTGQMHPGHPDLCYYRDDGKCVVPYHRIIVKNKHPEPPKEG